MKSLNPLKFVFAVACLLALASVLVPGVSLAIAQAATFVGPENLAMLSFAGATLAADKARPYELGELEAYPAIASDIIYEGAAVGENASGYARPLVAGDVFLGFAESQADNSTGSAGAIYVRVRTRGKAQLAVAGATAVTANDRPLVYASDDDTFTLTASTNSIIGRVSRWVSSGVCIVEFDSTLAAAEAARVTGDA